MSYGEISGSKQAKRANNNKIEMPPNLCHITNNAVLFPSQGSFQCNQVNSFLFFLHRVSFVFGSGGKKESYESPDSETRRLLERNRHISLL